MKRNRVEFVGLSLYLVPIIDLHTVNGLIYSPVPLFIQFYGKRLSVAIKASGLSEV
jgi:hypothetical protein